MCLRKHHFCPRSVMGTEGGRPIRRLGGHRQETNLVHLQLVPSPGAGRIQRQDGCLLG